MSDDAPQTEDEFARNDPPDSATIRAGKVCTGGRIWRMMTAAAIGWLAGFAVTAPVKIHDVVIYATGDERRMAYSLTYGLIVWGAITAGLAVVFVVLLLGPMATLVPTKWVVKHPRLSVGVLPILLLLPIGYHIIQWLRVDPGPYVYPLPLLGDYMAFTLAFFVVALRMYLQLLRRGLRADCAIAPERTLASDGNPD